MANVSVEALLILCIPYQIQLRVLAFLISSLHIWSVFLHSSQDTRSLFHFLYIAFLYSGLTSKSLVSLAGLLPSLLCFLHMTIKSFCTLRKMCLKSCQLSSAPLSLSATLCATKDYRQLKNVNQLFIHKTQKNR